MPKKSVRSRPPAKRAPIKPAKRVRMKPAKRVPTQPTKRVPTQPAKLVRTKPAKRVQIKPPKRVPILRTEAEPRPATRSTAAARSRTAKILFAALAQHAEETLKRFGALIRSGGDSASNRIESAPRGAGETIGTAGVKSVAAPKRVGRKK